jgi:hypothetical protein
MSPARRIWRHVRANTVAYIALFVALGGTSYAATQLPANSVGARQIKNHSITPSKLNPADIGASVRFWAVVNFVSGTEQVVESEPRATVASWDSIDDVGLLSWRRPIPRNCFPLATSAGGFARVLLPPLAQSQSSVQFALYSNTAQPSDGLVYIAVVCGVP